MDFDRIERLLAKYWECETTLDEEKELKKFFNSPNVPEHLSGYTSLFQYYEHEKNHGQLDNLFDQEVIERIEGLQEKPKKGKVAKLFYDVARAAAVVLVLITAGYFIKQEVVDTKENVQPYITDTFDDPQAAFEETKRALQMISANFKRGRKEARKVGVFNDAQQKAKDIDTEL